MQEHDLGFDLISVLKGVGGGGKDFAWILS